MLVEQLVVRPLYSRPLDAILATWGLSIVIGQLITIVFGRGSNSPKARCTGPFPCSARATRIYRLLLVGAALRARRG